MFVGGFTLEVAEGDPLNMEMVGVEGEDRGNSIVVLGRRGRGESRSSGNRMDTVKDLLTTWGKDSSVEEGVISETLL